jgi:serine/threonine protein kinase
MKKRSVDNYVGPYRILRLINRGGQGTVYLGYDKRLHRRVAIKIYTLPSQRAARKGLLREAQMVASVDTPKVVKIHDVIESGTHLALVMEYVPGCNLEEFLQQARPSLGSILTVCTDIAGALAIAAQQRIVHGDVKAGNVLITTSGRAKLADFGISKNTGEGQGGHPVAGSLSAVSPEQYAGEPVDERSDLFALGCLLYRMLSAQHPFYRDGRFNSDLLLRREPRPLEEIVGGEVELPPDLVRLTEGLLQKDPQHRTPNTRRVRTVLREVSRGVPMSGRKTLLPEARPFFRPESPEDIPPQIPAGLGEVGRSRLVPPRGRIAQFGQMLATLRWPARVAIGLMVTAAAAVPLVTELKNRATPIYFEQPVTTITADITLPPEVSRTWLVETVKQTLAEQLGNLYVLGFVGAEPVTTLYTDPSTDKRPSEPEQVFQIGLRCFEDLCVFNVDREDAGVRFNQQGLLYPDMSVEQWHDVVRSTTLALYH